jgi:tetratricopeptide (TPR) repeat protein
MVLRARAPQAGLRWRQAAGQLHLSKANLLPSRRAKMIRRCQLALLFIALLLGGATLAQKKPQKNSQPDPVFEPLKAEKSVEVGMFYLKKKNYDAAIERFQDALRYKPGFARPHLLLGQAYEKKGEFEDSILHYNAYLEILPNAEDANKVRRKIAALDKKLTRERSRRSRPNRGA